MEINCDHEKRLICFFILKKFNAKAQQSLKMSLMVKYSERVLTTTRKNVKAAYANWKMCWKFNEQCWSMWINGHCSMDYDFFSMRLGNHPYDSTNQICPSYHNFLMHPISENFEDDDANCLSHAVCIEYDLDFCRQVCNAITSGAYTKIIN